QKIPTPIKPIKIDSESKTVTLAYFEQKSTVDYIGAVQGIPICFDAKETTRKMLPIQNIHAHQIQFMRDFQRQGGLSFLLVSFRTTNEYFYLPFETLNTFWGNAQSGGRKSIPYEAFDKELLIGNQNGFYIHYLEAIDTVLKRGARESEEK
ncbi:MAG: Holliday junction resolvase RecU, partial [Clostridiales bacterium]|nr:Holliday junction resolvase RecU [Clostridiales bacterium]